MKDFFNVFIIFLLLAMFLAGLIFAVEKSGLSSKDKDDIIQSVLNGLNDD